MAFVNIRNNILIFLQRGDESSGGSVHVDANLVAFFFVDPGNLKTQQFVVKKHNISILMRCWYCFNIISWLINVVRAGKS